MQERQEDEVHIIDLFLFLQGQIVPKLSQEPINRPRSVELGLEGLQHIADSIIVLIPRTPQIFKQGVESLLQTPVHLMSQQWGNGQGILNDLLHEQAGPVRVSYADAGVLEVFCQRLLVVGQQIVHPGKAAKKANNFEKSHELIGLEAVDVISDNKHRSIELSQQGGSLRERLVPGLLLVGRIGEEPDAFLEGWPDDWNQVEPWGGDRSACPQHPANAVSSIFWQRGRESCEKL
ncbi:hypothetical protein A5728_10220 [Kocuria sp. ICS0012]|nr:hypothetical protein A5728_10220 [Kocuria sp. ICS0012]